MIFNRFAKEARRCVEAALEEARLLGHDSVGDEDLLLGVLRAGEGVAAEALSSMGVTSEAVREESEASFAEALASIGISLEEVRREAGEAFEMRLPDDRRIPFSPRAKKALEGALREAIGLGDNRITSEHVLRGHPLAGAQDAEQQVFVPDGVVAEQPRLLQPGLDAPPCLLGETVEDHTSFPFLPLLVGYLSRQAGSRVR